MASMDSSNTNETISVVIYNQHRVEGLEVVGLDAYNNLRAVINVSVTLQATLSGGSNLTAEWRIGQDVISKTYPPDVLNVTYEKTWTSPATYPVKVTVSNEQNAMSSSFNLTIVPCRAFYNFSLHYGETTTQLVTPGTTRDFLVVWDYGDDENCPMEVTGLLDETTDFNPTNLTQASTVNKGSATFTLDGKNLSIGRHTLNITADDTTETIPVVIYNEHRVEGLEVVGLDDNNTLWAVINVSVTLQATVTGGSNLVALWRIGQDVISQTYPPDVLNVTYENTWTSSHTYPVEVIVSNEQNAMSSSFNLTLLLPINGITMDKVEVKSEANVNVSFWLLYDIGIDLDMGDVDFTLEWGDSTPSLSGSLNITPGGDLSFVHEYTKQGDMVINMTLTTKVDSKLFQLPAYIWDELHVAMNITPEILSRKPGEEFTISFVDPPFEGFQYTINYTEGILENALSALSNDYVAPSPANLTFFYPNVGVYTVVFKAFNGAYEKESVKTVFVLNPLNADDFEMTQTDKVIPTPDGMVKIKLKMASNFEGEGTCHWSSGFNNETTVPEFMYMPDDFGFSKVFKYDVPDNYTIGFHCRNNVSEMMVTSNITVLGWNMSDFKIVVNNPQVMNDSIPIENATVKLTLLAADRPPTNLQATYNYGDGGSPEETFNVTTWGTYHLYPKRRNFTGTVLLTHPDKGNIIIDFQVRQGAFQIHLDLLEGLVDTQLFSFTVEVPGPFTGTLNIDYGDGLQHWTEPVSNANAHPLNITAPYYYKSVGDFSAKLYGSSTEPNRSYTEQVDFDGPIYIEGAVADFEFAMTPERVQFPTGEVNATVKLTRSQHRIRQMQCVLYFGETLDPEPRYWNGSMQPGGSFSIDFQYLTLGSKTVNTNCSNLYSQQNIETFASTFNPCFSEDPIFDRQYGHSHSPMNVLNSKTLRLVTRTVILCFKAKPEFTWRILRWSVGGQDLGEYDDFVQPYADYIEFPPGSLEPGLYKLFLNISFGPEHDHIYMVEHTYVRVIRIPLEAEILGGAFRLTGNPRATVDGYSLSYDPVSGLENKTGLEYVWECLTLNTSTMDDLMAVASQPLSDNRTSDCNDISNETTNGTRQLQVPAINVTSVGYMFQLKVKKDKYVSSPTTLFIQYSSAAFTISLV
ncbi:uncharacterized protein [Littorina saxatilis]|uniref:uncharacterized protein n=1 Tax=Littorina saxatilis TaxID=31220 RepID=UPI0038B57940